MAKGARLRTLGRTPGPTGPAAEGGRSAVQKAQRVASSLLGRPQEGQERATGPPLDQVQPKRLRSPGRGGFTHGVYPTVHSPTPDMPLPPTALQQLLASPVAHKVRARGDGVGLLAYLLRTFSALDEAQIRRAVDEGRFRMMDGATLGPDDLLSEGDTLLGDVPHRQPEDPFALPLPERLAYVYRDAHLLAGNKPPGLLSYPLGPRKVAAQSWARLQLEEAGEPGELRPLHRIDRETTGILMFARDLPTDQGIKAAFQRREVRKSYLALVRGRLEGGPRTVNAPIGDDVDHAIRMRMCVTDDGLEAITEVRPLACFGEGQGYTWLQCVPKTGRTHQIRVHMAHLGHPLVGDKMYVGDGEAFLRWWDGSLDASDMARLEHPRQALHAWTTVLVHPIWGTWLQMMARPPADLLSFAAERGGGDPGPPQFPELNDESRWGWTE